MKEVLLYKSKRRGPNLKESDYIIINSTIVDDEDFEVFNKYRWFIDNGYACRKERFYINNSYEIKAIYLHRELLSLPRTTDRKSNLVDHINHNKLDNRKCNLRIVTQQENTMNRISHRRTISKFKGVSWHKCTGKWQSRLMFYNKILNLGLFNSELEAAIAYNEKAKELFGKYAKLNEV
jgi:hypothetical protein